MVVGGGGAGSGRGRGWGAADKLPVDLCGVIKCHPGKSPGQSPRLEPTQAHAGLF